MKTTILGFLIVMALFFSCSGTKTPLKNNIGSFSESEVKMILSSDTLSPMRVYKITNQRDSLLLRSKSSYIKPDPNNKVLIRLIKRLYRTVTDSMSLGAGIAAPQVGVLKNIVWVQRFDKENFPFEVYLNPMIIGYSEKKQTYKEGCLSIPNRSETLNNRSYSIVIVYDTVNGEDNTETVEGFTSVIFQHEIDHLNGILYLDHLNKEINDANKSD
ncbi:MAG: peptide deformylase [Flavobacteriales bacterium]|nr:peptide deformylase [Flavobacteriia bacterium]NCP05658.1 peptide deformylase [Flavobacteriales bacterium]PIV93099.1 MAG: peptide deformylase [Flavobacteriaceae bacterium CG17_big_fil_post_rev_8_21_14_2_50_33_15]PIY11905.1 MAG: peptide deformylase [Flavobacteriaceae bacterium CG_4_10_14_3_um_filter_33_47]PJB18322.1 MAG: peptide deformylase [Flavobacteriaceae bacterium CG_4_9_14_3_um_filter_33_16]